jgi:hypothetical protein
MIVQHLWNDSDKGNLSQGHLPSRMDWPGIETGLPKYTAATNGRSHGTASECP